MKKYALVSDYIGYLNKKDITNCDPRALIAPSQNVIINDSERVEVRGGTELDGQADSSGDGIVSSFDWNTNSNTERNIRVGGETMQVRYNNTTISYGLRAYWKLDEASGNAADSVGIITLTNTDVTYDPGKINNGAVFNGSTSKLEGTASSIVDTANVTVSAWIKMDPTISNDANIFNNLRCGGGSTIHGYCLDVGPSGNLQFIFGDGTTTPRGSSDTTDLRDNTLHFVVATFDGVDIKLYIDNVLVKTQNRNYAIDYTTAGTVVQIGKRVDGFKGLIDEVGVWNRVLSNEEIGQLYNSGSGLAYSATAMGSVDDTYYLDIFTTSSNDVNFTTWWSTTENKDLLLFVQQNDDISMWSGAITTFASATENTITKQGATTWAEDRFLLAGTRQVIMDGVTYTYTGGEGTTTLTGVTPDPTTVGHPVGSIIYQAVRTTANTPASGLTNSTIDMLNNHVYVGGYNSRAVYISKSTDYTSFAFSSPRVPTEGALLYLDSNVVGFANSDDGIEYISGTKNDWYKVEFKKSDDLTKEDVEIKRLKTGPGQGARTQGSIGNIKNAIAFVSTEGTVDEIGRLESYDTPQSKPLSDSIKLELANADYSVSPHTKFFKGKIYITIPSESKVLIYDLDKAFWNPPQTLSVSRFAIIDNELYGHSNDNKETYKLFTGTSDNGVAIYARAAFAYRNFGRPDWKKSFNNYLVEGYISPNTTLTCGFKYEFGGSKGIVEKTIVGTDSAIILQSITDGSLGKNPLGSQPLGSITDSIDDMPKFRKLINMTKKDFYEIGVLFESNDVDFRWQLLRHGPNVLESTADGVEYKG